jgi:hypothetical protein
LFFGLDVLDVFAIAAFDLFTIVATIVATIVVYFVTFLAFGNLVAFDHFAIVVVFVTFLAFVTFGNLVARYIGLLEFLFLIACSIFSA